MARVRLATAATEAAFWLAAHPLALLDLALGAVLLLPCAVGLRKHELEPVERIVELRKLTRIAQHHNSAVDLPWEHGLKVGLKLLRRLVLMRDILDLGTEGGE